MVLRNMSRKPIPFRCRHSTIELHRSGLHWPKPSPTPRTKWLVQNWVEVFTLNDFCTDNRIAWIWCHSRTWELYSVSKNHYRIGTVAGTLMGSGNVNTTSKAFVLTTCLLFATFLILTWKVLTTLPYFVCIARAHSRYQGNYNYEHDFKILII